MSENEKTKRYYLKRNFNWHGPFSVDQIRVFIRNGKFSEQDFISKDKKNTKYKLGSVAGFKNEFKTRQEAEPSNEDRKFNLEKNGELQGPFTADQIRTTILRGETKESDWISRVGSPNKYRIGSVGVFRKCFKTRNEAEAVRKAEVASFWCGETKDFPNSAKSKLAPTEKDPTPKENKQGPKDYYVYVQSSGFVKGPFTLADVPVFSLQGDDLLWRQGSRDKVKLRDVDELRRYFDGTIRGAIDYAEFAPYKNRSKSTATKQKRIPRKNRYENTTWYVKHVSGNHPPKTWEELKALIRQGDVGGITVICCDLDKSWRPALEFPIVLEFLYAEGRISEETYESAPRPTTLFNESVGGVVAVVALICVIAILFGGGGGRPRPSLSPVDMYNSSIPAGMSREESNFIGNTALENGRSIEDATHIRDGIHKLRQIQGK